VGDEAQRTKQSIAQAKRERFTLTSLFFRNFVFSGAGRLANAIFLISFPRWDVTNV
jgi:hypothetical protein